MPSSSASSSSANDIKLTATEAKQFNEAFKSEEFCRLMADYVDSLSDPANREQQEAYISELEANKELPPGKSLIRPNAGFVVKCHISGTNGKPLKKKIFLNLVHSDAIMKPSKEEEKTSSQAKWSVPYAIGPVRMEHDKSNNLVPTFDICFHPLSLQYAHARKEFRDMVIGISQSAVMDAYSKSSGEDITIDSNYTILKNVRYKNGTPKTLIVSSRDQSSAQDRVKEDLSAKPIAAPDFAEEAADATTHKESLSDEEVRKVILPKYKIVEQGMFELTNQSRRPKQLIMHVYLENVASASEIDLDVSETKVHVGSEKHGYSLDAKLPYPIDSQKGKATFDKAKRSLILRLPLLPLKD